MVQQDLLQQGYRVAAAQLGQRRNDKVVCLRLVAALVAEVAGQADERLVVGSEDRQVGVRVVQGAGQVGRNHGIQKNVEILIVLVEFPAARGNDRGDGLRMVAGGCAQVQNQRCREKRCGLDSSFHIVLLGLALCHCTKRYPLGTTTIPPGEMMKRSRSLVGSRPIRSWAGIATCFSTMQ